MVKKTPVTPRAPQRPAKTDVVTRVSAEAVRHRALTGFKRGAVSKGDNVEDWLVAETELLKDNNIEIAPHLR